MLDAFERIAASHPDALLVLAGPDEFGIEHHFEKSAHAAGLARRVRFPGMVTGERKSALLHRADLFCLPSDAEGFSMAILEALAHETAVLISPRCFFPAVGEVGAGHIVEPTVDALESALRDLLSRSDRLGSMGRAGRALVAEHYTWGSVTTAMLDAYEEGIDRFRRGLVKRA